MDEFFRKMRNTLHQMPEIALNEYKTSEFIREFLKDVWIPPTLLNKNFKDVSKEANEPLNKKLVFQ